MLFSCIGPTGPGPIGPPGGPPPGGPGSIGNSVGMLTVGMQSMNLNALMGMNLLGLNTVPQGGNNIPSQTNFSGPGMNSLLPNPLAIGVSSRPVPPNMRPDGLSANVIAPQSIGINLPALNVLGAIGGNAGAPIGPLASGTGSGSSGSGSAGGNDGVVADSNGHGGFHNDMRNLGPIISVASGFGPTAAANPPPGFVCPVRPDHGREGQQILLRANHFQIRMPKGVIHHYEVAIQPDKCPRRVNRCAILQFL